jgi:branched-chain amino acid transport system permease protein
MGTAWLTRTGSARHRHLLDGAGAGRRTYSAVYRILRRAPALPRRFETRDRAESVGVDNFRTKLWVYVHRRRHPALIGRSFIWQARISPDAAFSVLDWTAYVIFIVVIGGIGTIEGPIIGVIIFYLMQTYLSTYGTWYLILLGALAIVIMLFAPKGIWGYVSDRWGLVLFPVQRRLQSRVVPTGSVEK